MSERFPNATPRPWQLDTIEGGGWAVVVEADGKGARVVAELNDTFGDRAANAALIVEAVNAYGQPAAPPQPLDVPRLRDALRRVYKSRYHERFAEPLAAEYAHLSRKEPSE